MRNDEYENLDKRPGSGRRIYGNPVLCIKP
jgi:hypothetical protein